MGATSRSASGLSARFADTRLAAADRLWLTTVAAAPRSEAAWRWWRGVTHLGGATATTLACALPLLAGGAARRAGVFITAVVLLSQLLVHLTKRLVGRPRPARGALADAAELVVRAAEPDAFSFPSGHSAAAAAVALGYAIALPPTAPVLLPLAVLVGVSRVVLGVHFPGDVAAGVFVSAAAAAAVHCVMPNVR